ncbi:MAG: hypothetical protein HY645_09430 [Acidobacteria bacterium]|nr:hypothetical protein [Acidobacteriota bacterium]
MTRNCWKPFFVILADVCFVLAFGLNNALAHCDGMDRPVVKAAQRALGTGNVNLVLIWVQQSDEPEIRKAFEETLAVRKLSPAAGELADRYFFETLVRIHRAGEDAPYTGLKPAGGDLGPAIPGADKALEDRSIEQLLKLLSEAVQNGVREHFQSALAKSDYKENEVEAGQAYVKAYVEYIHYVERIYEAAKNPAAGHFAESGEK